MKHYSILVDLGQLIMKHYSILVVLGQPIMKHCNILVDLGQLITKHCIIFTDLRQMMTKHTHTRVDQTLTTSTMRSIDTTSFGWSSTQISSFTSWICDEIHKRSHRKSKLASNSQHLIIRLVLHRILTDFIIALILSTILLDHRRIATKYTETPARTQNERSYRVFDSRLVGWSNLSLMIYASVCHGSIVDQTVGQISH